MTAANCVRINANCAAPGRPIAPDADPISWHDKKRGNSPAFYVCRLSRHQRPAVHTHLAIATPEKKGAAQSQGPFCVLTVYFIFANRGRSQSKRQAA